jgi:putative alpha-1,2-mannosidase
MHARSVLCFCFTSLLFLPAFLSHAQSTSSPYAAVDPLIGTAGGGNTFPGATLPFGMVQWSPDTDSDGWYHYDKKQIFGFGLTHISGAGCPLYGDFAVLPATAELAASPGTNFAPYAVDFNHTDETAHPGYYAITLGNGVCVEITVTDRAGKGIYVQKLMLDGTNYPSSWLPLGKLPQGVTTLQFTMGEQPNMRWGRAIADRPPSFR